MPLEQYAAIFPVSAAGQAVDIFVREVGTPAKADIAVNNAELAVVAVVHRGVDVHAAGVEHRHLNTFFTQRFVIMARKLIDGTHVVIHQSYQHPCAGFLL
ncbi:hypothetical protein DSECCO2_456430 [anaerobic digester metagenome]